MTCHALTFLYEGGGGGGGGSYYSNVLSLSKEKKENILALTGLKRLLKNVENTEDQIASLKQKADIHYKK